MLNRLLDQYYMISNELERKDDEELDDLISSFDEIIISEQNPSNAVAKTEKEPDMYAKRNKAKFALLCLRIAVNCQLISYACQDYQEQLQQDIFKAIEKAESIEYKWKMDDAVISDTFDVILALCPSCEDILKTYFDRRYGLFQQNYNEVTPDLYHLFNIAADYYRQHGREEQAVVILEYLCCVSRRRNSAERHRELVSKILAQIGEKEPEAVCRIGKADEEQFDGVIDEYAGDFFWFYACSLSRLEDRATAEKYLKKCYLIREKIYGDENWFTAIAKNEYHKIVFISSDGRYGLKEILSFIDKIESGLYVNVDKGYLAAVEGNSLYITLWKKSNLKNMPEYDQYLKIFEKICDQYNDTSEPLLKKRLAKNFRGRYWMEKGNYMQAETAFLGALYENIMPEVPEIITEAQIKSNLLTAYCLQNDIEQAVPLLMELLAMIDNDEHEEVFTVKDIYRIYTLKINMELQDTLELNLEEMGELKNIVIETCHDVQRNKSEISEYAEELAVFLLCSILQIIQNEYASVKEQSVFLAALQEIEKDITLFSIEPGRRILLYLILAILTWNLNISETEFYINKSVELLESSGIPKVSKVSVLQTAAVYFGKKGKDGLAMEYVERSLSELTFVWRAYVRYLNDARLMNILNPVQSLFGSCYAILRKHADIEKAYEKVLRFKALASLAGRERNHFLNSGRYDKSLLEEIRILQDKIAMLETEQMLRDITDEFAQEERKLRSLEAEFAQQFPCRTSFAEITLDRVKKVIPDNSVIIEYFFCALEYGMRQFEKKKGPDDTGLDIYITKKENNQFEIKRITISDGMVVLERACEFINILQAESDGSASIEQIYEKEDIRTTLYQKLIAPLLLYIQGIKNLYIAPDYDLVNLPFEILFGEEEIRLGDYYNVIKIECARDFLFAQSGCSAEKGSLIIGNPQYEVEMGKLGRTSKGESEKRSAFLRDVDNISQLPFSELEAQLIGRRSKSIYYSGADAAKRLILSADGYKNIHIATHGYFDLEEKGKTVFSSCILLAGVKNWVKTGEISEIYGNGIITADEISRLDLRSVELAVLSSCLNGMSEAAGSREFYGMVGALSAAGVHYVISHLWSADDFGTAVLMDVFYYLYLEEKLDPPEALNMAKNYLRNVTIGQLRKRKWLAYIKNHIADLNVRKRVQEYERYDDRMRPFKSEAYWAGFSCYCCNG